MLIGEPDDTWLLASDAGYGFKVRLKELYARDKKGKSVLKVPENALVLPAQPIANEARSRCWSTTTAKCSPCGGHR